MSNRMSPLALSAALVLILGFISQTRAADNYVVDPAHTFITFRIKHMNIGYSYGRFDMAEGTVVVDSDTANSAFAISVKTDSIDTGIKKRDDHLKSPDFFAVADYPTISFKSSSVKKTGDSTMEVTGDLTLHGQTNTIMVTMNKTGEGKDPMGNQRIGFETNFSIKRSDYGMKGMLTGASDEVQLSVSFEAIKK